MRNLSPTTTEDHLRELFALAASGQALCAARSLWNPSSDSSVASTGSGAGAATSAITKVKVIRDYAFVHFQTREQALIALRVLDSKCL